MQNTNTMKNPITNHLMKSNGVDPKLIEPEGDFRGLDPIYLKSEGERAYFAAGLQTVLAVHLSYLTFAWLVYDGHYVDGVVCSFFASWLWSRVIVNVRYAFKCNLEADGEETEEQAETEETPKCGPMGSGELHYCPKCKFGVYSCEHDQF